MSSLNNDPRPLEDALRIFGALAQEIDPLPVTALHDKVPTVWTTRVSSVERSHFRRKESIAAVARLERWSFSGETSWDSRLGIDDDRQGLKCGDNLPCATTSSSPRVRCRRDWRNSTTKRRSGARSSSAARSCLARHPPELVERARAPFIYRWPGQQRDGGSTRAHSAA
jgi:hypothetical protein